MVRGGSKHVAGVHAIASIAKELGGNVQASGQQLEVQVPGQVSKSRVDVCFYGIGTGMWAVDFFSMEPMISLQAEKAENGKFKMPLQVSYKSMAQEEQRKREQYQVGMGEKGFKFVPFGVDTLGFVSSEAKSVIGLFANAVGQEEGICVSWARKAVKRSIAAKVLKQVAINGINAMGVAKERFFAYARVACANEALGQQVVVVPRHHVFSH